MKFLKLLMITSVFLWANVAFADVAVIVNKSNNQTLDKKTIKRIYLNKAKTFANGNEIISAGLEADNVTTEEFNDKVLQKSAAQLKSYWAKLMFTGSGTPPTEFKTAQAVIDFVKSNANAIGFIDSSKATTEVKIVEIF